MLGRGASGAGLRGALNDNRAMSRRIPSPWPVRLTTLALWALAAASAAFWGLRLSTPASLPAAPASPAAVAAPDVQAMARLLGVQPSAAMASAQPAAGSRYALVGLLAGQDGASGAALIAVAGRPAKPFRVGSTVDGDLVLQSLDAHAAKLGPAGAQATLTLSVSAGH
jgi:general secretion pathway protein C